MDICVYHSPCTDGLVSAWVVKSANPSVVLLECIAGENPTVPVETFSNKKVIFVDVCPKIEYLIDICKVANKVLIIDHHITYYTNYQTISPLSNLNYIFDTKKCGCELVWEYFFPNINMPWFFVYVSDRDLWKSTVPFSKEIGGALYQERHLSTIQSIQELTTKNNLEFRSEMIKVGKNIIHLKNEMIYSVIRSDIKRCKYKDYNIWLYTCQRYLLSDVGSKLCKWRFKDQTYPDFVVYWAYDVNDHKFYISLRSSNEENSVDVQKIAKEIHPEGGGHYHAAGLTLEGSTVIRDIFIPVA